MRPSAAPNCHKRGGNGRSDLPGSWVFRNAPDDLTTSNIALGVLFPFVRSAAIYHCPADRSTVTDHEGLLRTRSYSLNWYLASNAPKEYYTPRLKLRYSEIVSPGPSQVYAFIDEDDRTINDGTFFSPQEFDRWGDLPAVRHALGSNLSFADGHADRCESFCNSPRLSPYYFNAQLLVMGENPISLFNC